MKNAYPRLIAAALALAITPALAQPAPTASVGSAGWAGHHGPGPYAALSPDGRQILKAARQATHNDGTRAQIDATRAQIMTLLDADTLDVHALSRAMVTERSLSQGEKLRQQAALLAAYQKLSLADRHAYVAASRAIAAQVAAARAAHQGHVPQPPM